MKYYIRQDVGGMDGRSPCGERGLKFGIVSEKTMRTSRSPCGERGLKLHIDRASRLTGFRRSPCGERGLKFAGGKVAAVVFQRRSPCGERGLKSWRREPAPLSPRRSPCGERGLKFRAAAQLGAAPESLPVRGAWVEIICSGGVSVCRWTSLPVRGAWVEIKSMSQPPARSASLPVRGAWVEISCP